MMQRTIRLGWRAARAIALSGLTLAVAAACQTGELDVRHFANRIDIHPRFNHDGGSLTVVGGPIAVESRFGRGGVLRIEPVDESGKALPDGAYGWEISFNSTRIQAVARGLAGRSPEQEARGLRAAEARRRERGCRADRQVSRAMVFSGSFLVEGGSIVDPQQKEPGTIGR